MQDRGRDTAAPRSRTHENRQAGPPVSVWGTFLYRRERCPEAMQSKFFFLCQVLSHNLYTVLHIPHDPVALEEHFRDDDDGPVSSQGYMPYLNKYILDKVSTFALTGSQLLLN